MKKNLFLVALAAVALASCASEELVDEIVENEVAINFEGYAENVTRAEQDKELVELKKTGFGVYGSKTASSTTTAIFSNEKVSWNSTDSKWTYTNTKYWDKTATYAFYAIAPQKASDYSCTNGMFTIDAVASGLASASDDYIIDRDGATGISGAYTGTHDKVSFDFHHIMSKVDFKLAKASGITDDVTVQSIKMSGWNSGNGKFVQTLTKTPNSLVNTEWTIASPGSGDVEILSAETAALPTTAAASTTQTFIMVPQDIDENTLTFTINYKIGTEPFTAQVGTVAAAQVWGTDSHITYTLTIGPAAIEFDVDSVCGFCVEGTGGATVN